MLEKDSSKPRRVGSDLARVEAHAIKLDEYKELPPVQLAEIKPRQK